MAIHVLSQINRYLFNLTYDRLPTFNVSLTSIKPPLAITQFCCTSYFSLIPPTFLRFQQLNLLSSCPETFFFRAHVLLAATGSYFNFEVQVDKITAESSTPLYSLYRVKNEDHGQYLIHYYAMLFSHSTPLLPEISKRFSPIGKTSHDNHGSDLASEIPITSLRWCPRHHNSLYIVTIYSFQCWGNGF